MEVFLKPFVKFWCSLRLTVVCLMAALVLVFVGTLAQVDQGLYDAQKKYFRSYLLIPEAVGGAGWAQIRMGGRSPPFRSYPGKQKPIGRMATLLGS